MGQPALMTGLDDGNRFNQDAVLQLFILSALRRSLSNELQAQNQSVQENNMREVRDLATGMKEAIASIRKANVEAKGGLEAEIARANVNASKVVAFTTELREANLEVEAFLGETGSNFSSSDTSDIQQPKTLPNGVTLNKEPGA